MSAEEPQAADAADQDERAAEAESTEEDQIIEQMPESGRKGPLKRLSGIRKAVFGIGRKNAVENSESVKPDEDEQSTTDVTVDAMKDDDQHSPEESQNEESNKESTPDADLHTTQALEEEVMSAEEPQAADAADQDE